MPPLPPPKHFLIFHLGKLRHGKHKQFSCSSHTDPVTRLGGEPWVSLSLLLSFIASLLNLHLKSVCLSIYNICTIMYKI